jgi:MutS domain V.
MLSDAIVTIRNDRFVLPVKAEYRSHFGGFVHDQSASGQTLFIEPESVVAMNNEVRELKKKEEAEIERILLELSQEAGSRREEIDEIVRVMQRADLIFAKAKYGSAYKGSKPAVNQKGYIRLLKARHPLLPADQAVPNDIELGKDYTAIVITGPNTGGKTVTLKTVGLLVLMAQAGLMIPALDGSELSVFRAVHADIGDEQSIEQNLSTFSSHMTNIVTSCGMWTNRASFSSTSSGRVRIPRKAPPWRWPSSTKSAGKGRGSSPPPIIRN